MEKLEEYKYINKTKTIKEIARGDMIKAINELVEEHGELIARVERVTTAYHDLRERLDNHISKHKEYAEGGDPCQKKVSDI